MQEKILQKAYDDNYNQVGIVPPADNQTVPQITLKEPTPLAKAPERLSAFHHPIPRYGLPFHIEQTQDNRQQTTQSPMHSALYTTTPIPIPAQNRPKSPPATMFLTPSRGSGPVMTSYQTPPTRGMLQQRHTEKPSPSDSERSCEEDEIDVVNDVKHADSSREIDMSISTNNTLSSIESPSTGRSNNSSPASNSTSSPLSTDSSGTKKKVRTNYSPQQVQALEKVFHENPYPESEVMEKLAGELDIPETKIKVWFQNKRARWRRRAAENPHPAYMPPMSPMMSPMGSYGMVPHHHPMLHGSPSQVVPGPFFYPGPPMGTPVHHGSHPQHYGTPGRVVPSTPVTNTNSSPASTTSSTSSPANSSEHHNLQSPHTQMTPPYQHRLPPPFSPYMPFSIPYGMCPPYYC